MINVEQIISSIIKLLNADEDLADTEITKDTCPVTELGLDSIYGVEFSIDLEGSLPIDIPCEQNLFYTETGNPRSIKDIGDFCLELINRKG